MRQLAYLAVIVAAIAGAVLGPMAFSAREKTQAATEEYQPPGDAGKVYRQGTYSVTLTELPCPFEEIASDLESEGIPPAKATSIISGGRHWHGCWAKDIGGDAMVRDPMSLERGTIPIDWFRRE